MTLEPEDREKVLEMVVDQVTREVIEQGSVKDLVLLSPARAAGLLDVTPSTLAALEIPRLDLGKRMIRYRQIDIEKYLETREVKP